jgi:Mg/Co/Ni transporter MgtE
VIPWEAVDVIETDPLRRVKLRLPESKLKELHPADIADIIEDLAPGQREAVIETLDDTTAAETLEEVEDSIQVKILENLDRERIIHILEEMHRDEAVDALAEMSAETAAQVLQDMDRQDAGELETLLQFEQDTAGGMMTTEVFVLAETGTVADAIVALRKVQEEEELEFVDTLHLQNAAGVFTGAIPLDRILVSEPGQSLKDLLDEQLVFVETVATEKEVMELFDKYNLRSLPVVDEEKKLAGVVTVDDIVSRLWQRQS